MIKKPTTGTRLIWTGVVLLIILRQDIWFWNDPSLVLGIFPVGLAWQIGISIAAAMLWYTATRIAWPIEEVFQEEVFRDSPSPTPILPSDAATERFP